MYGADGDIYFVADITANEKTIKNGSPEVMKSVNNIWKISDKGGMPVQVTKHADGNLFFPSISADRKTIVYEDNFGLWKLDTASGKNSEIRIDIKSDSKTNDTELVTMTNEAEGFHLSPSNQRAAIVVHGEIFTIATDRGEPQRVTETPWREQDVRWSPNGKWIAFVSDRTGRQEVWISDELGKTPKKLSDADCDKTALIWAPDSKSLLWTGSDHKLRRVDIDTGKTDIVVENAGGNIGTPQFSPDGKWISYSKQDNLLRTHVFVKNLASGDEHMITSDQFQVATGAQVDPRWQEAAADRRREPAEHGVHRLPRHAQPALQRLPDAPRQGSRRSRGQYRGAGPCRAQRERRRRRAVADARDAEPARPRRTSPWTSSGTAWSAASRSSPT